MFGWGNAEYSQLDCVAPGLSQVSKPKHLNLRKIVGNVVDVAATGSSCAVVNGEKLRKRGASSVVLILFNFVRRR